MENDTIIKVLEMRCQLQRFIEDSISRCEPCHGVGQGNTLNKLQRLNLSEALEVISWVMDSRLTLNSTAKDNIRFLLETAKEVLKNG